MRRIFRQFRKKLTFIPVDKKNIKTILTTYRHIFWERCCAEIRDADQPQKYGVYNFIRFWLVYAEDRVVGMTGLSSYPQYPKDAFMEWYGVLPEERGKGYGEKIFKWTIRQAGKLGFKTFRLYTEKGDNDAAIAMYRKMHMREEPYTNENGIENMVMFSMSLTKRRVPLWKNKYIAIWQSDMLYTNNLKKLVMSNWYASLMTILKHPRTLYYLIKNKLFK